VIVRIWRFLAEFALLGSAAAQAAEATRVVVLPFANLSGADRAPAEIAAGFTRRIAGKGYSAAPEADVEAFLAAERIRYLDSLTGPVRQKLLAQLSASAVVFGTVYNFAEGPDAVVGISARMLRSDGGSVWAGVVGLTTRDTEGALGLHRVTSSSRLAENALDELMSDFPAPGSAVKLAAARARPLRAPAPVTFRSAVLDAGRSHAICVLPFENQTSARLAGRVVAELLAQRLASSGIFSLVEPADLRAALVASGVHGLRTGDQAELAKLSKAVGTSLFLTGTIYAFTDTSPRNTSITPELELDLTLVDAVGGRVVWTTRVARKGMDYEGLLELGAISNIVTLTDQATAEIVRAAEGSKEQGRKLSVTAGVSAANKTYDGTAAATITSCELSGLLQTDAALVTCSVTAALFSDANAGSGKSVTAKGITLSGSAAGLYALSSQTATTMANISRKPVTASVTASPKAYDRDTAATIVSCSLSDVLATDGARVKCSAGSASFADPNAGAGKTVTASAIILSGTASGNYALSSTTATATADVLRRRVTATVTAPRKTYDGTNVAAIGTCTLSGVVIDDSVAVACSPAVATFADARVATAKVVTASGIGLSGAASGNYELTSTAASTTADIVPRPVATAITASIKIYDGTEAAAVTGCTLADAVPSDSGRVGCQASRGAFADRTAGAGKAVTASVALAGEAADNYVLSSGQAAATADIRPRTLSVSGVSAENKVYDGTTAAALNIGKAALENLVAGDDVVLQSAGAAGTFADRNSGGGKSVTVSGLTIGGGDARNYALTQPNMSASITPRQAEAHITAASKVYDGTMAAALEAQTLTGVLDVDANDLRLTVTGAAFDTKDAATRKTVTVAGFLSGGASANYALSTPTVTATADITSKPITGSFEATDKQYDGRVEATVRSRSLEEVIAGDDVQLSGGTAAFSDKRASAGKVVRLIGATLSGADAGNYSLRLVGSAAAEITPRPITGSFTARDKTYDGSERATVLTRSLTGALADDDVRLAGGVARFDDKDVGTGKTVRLSGARLSGLDAGNYTLDSVAAATASITARPERSAREKS
jgi:hypothetical protein